MDAPGKKFEIQFSDNEMGTPTLGWMPRKPGQDPDDEDLAYQKFLKKKGIMANVYDGRVVLL